jgi:hypothetical protein
VISDADDKSSAGQDDAREIVTSIKRELEASSLLYGQVYRQVEAAGQLDRTTRDSVIQVLAQVATTLRRLGPSLAATRTLPEEERPDVALVLLRLLTDSLSVALAESPAVELMVAPNDVHALASQVGADHGAETHG